MSLLVPHTCAYVPQVLYGRRQDEGMNLPSTMFLLYTYIGLSSGGQQRLATSEGVSEGVRGCTQENKLEGTGFIHFLNRNTILLQVLE